MHTLRAITLLKKSSIDVVRDGGGYKVKRADLPEAIAALTATARNADGHEVGFDPDWDEIAKTLMDLDFGDSSWYNDITGSFSKELVPEDGDKSAIELRVWVQPMDESKREGSGDKRFTITKGSYGENTEDILETDLLSEVVKFLRNFKATATAAVGTVVRACHQRSG